MTDSTVREILGRELEGLRCLTTPEAAHVLGVSERTVVRLINSGQLAVTKIGRTTRISTQVIRDFISRNTYDADRAGRAAS
jgi:excisionase family DNA binding protein